MDEKGRLPLKAKPAGNFLEYVIVDQAGLNH